ncbi:pilus assembly protein PilY [Pseudomonas sp. J452]|uniref:PilC/PilY family type IV pilus protein n=1 Tax=Pseudomonas sp. J452 TaxID=2898441 RepID=UPI0021ADD795|nr:PilC/PilY family type IV pilus protein [Pseudomonas sp. J452]UUY10140.1 pilus assembly protein PilY [Pseudomonas sp. J452]
MNKRLSALHRLALSTVASALVLHSAISYGDDTEIFFGGAAIDDSVRPNVLFVLDNSGSMAWRTGSNNNPGSGEKSRMQILKESFSSIINNAGAINAGIMVLNSRSIYDGRMVYPVTNIDDPLPSSANLVASTPEILVSGDDATQSSLGGGAVINGTTLQMGYVTTSTTTLDTQSSDLQDNDAFFQSRYNSIDWACRMNEPGNDHNTNNDGCGNDDQSNINLRSNNDTNTGNANPIIGTSLLYFRALNIPAAVRLEPSFKAYLDLRPTNSQNSNKPTLRVTMQDSKTPAAMNDLTQVNPGRTYLAATDFANTPWNSASVTRLDVTDLFKQVLDNDAAALQQVFLKVRATTTTDYTFCTRNCGTSGGVSNAPRLVIEYNSTSIINETKKAALRFQNVGIPQGATITSARIDFAPATSNADPLTLQVRAEKVSDASTFSAGNDFAARTPKTTALTSWTPPAWVNQSPATHENGPDVTAVVQEVVSTAGWCGNNAMAFYFEPSAGSGSRTTYSIDGAPGLQPTLTVNYTGGTGGCLNPIIEASITNPKNDAYEENDDDMVLGGNTLPVDRNRFAARYEGIPILRGATILDTRVILTPANTVSNTNQTVTVRFENADNSAPFTGNDDDITDRNDTADSSCTLSSWVTGSPVICSGPELKTGLQGIVNRGGWTPGNAISLMSVQSQDSTLEVQAYESNPAESIKLRIKVASGGIASTTTTVRNQLDALVQSMNAGDGTPIVPTMNEAARYLRGERTGYSSPITSACQSTHLVVLTDGQANGNGAQSSIGTLTGSSCTGDATLSDEQCGRRLATWMAETDQSSIADDNFITTHTIGFALGALAPNTGPQTFLTDMANNGKGQAYTAENASELSAAFSKILQDVLSTDTTFVSPGATVNQFNRQSNKNEVYFALFKPAESNRWVGNLKRYALNSGAGDIIIDADNVGAIDSNTGFFKTTARSFWNLSVDGNNTAVGGVASQLPSYISRKLYTYVGNSPVTPVDLTGSAYLLNTANSNVTSALLGAADTTERTQLINWIRGLNDDATPRKAVGDPLHSVPRLVTYKCTEFTDTNLTTCKTGKEDQTAFLGTNEGLVHAFNTNDGSEQMAYMPEALLGNIKHLKLNEESTSLNPRKYGMDNTVSVWVNDVNKNGVIYGGRDPALSAQVGQVNGGGLNTGEFVYAYATMGRGGRNLYSLDVTDVNAPKLRWFITPNTPGFSRLGQTWSTPVVTKIDINGTQTPIIIFTGGYDETQDNVSILDKDNQGNARTQDQYGNAIYIVNAVTGALIWSGSSEVANASAQAHQNLSKMRYSMPSSVRAIDINRDGLADQFFVGDMGGQLWRFFINNGSSTSSLVSPADSASGSTADGVIASVIPAITGGESDAQLKSNLRRFYNAPDIVLTSVYGGKTLAINIGSGYRGHPLDTGADDRFYSFRTPIIYTNASHNILTEEEMYDTTLNLIQEGSAAQQADAAAAFAKSEGGWYIRMENDGEKVLAEASTISGMVFFNTYEPNNGSANNSCKAVQGTGHSYAVNLFNATPIQQRVDGTPDRGDRSKVLLTAGIPPKSIILFPEGRKEGVVCSGPECVDVNLPSPGPTYWIDER